MCNAVFGFTVATGASAGDYKILATGNTGKTASGNFTVRAPSVSPALTLSTSSSGPRTVVTVSGLHYVGTTCTALTSSPSSLLTSPSCSISAGALSGTFTVASTASSGGYTVTVTTDVASDNPSPASFTVTTTPPLPKCLIATATFGSEASPRVQFLRNFRDNLVVRTKAGSAFMEVFNAWYYSFSLTVAQFIANNDPIRAPVRVFLYPLLGVLGIVAGVRGRDRGTRRKLSCPASTRL
jgi:hypothetical protein